MYERGFRRFADETLGEFCDRCWEISAATYESFSDEAFADIIEKAVEVPIVISWPVYASDATSTNGDVWIYSSSWSSTF